MAPRIIYSLKYAIGFTLLELLLVLAIIGFSSALLIPRLNSDVKLYDAQLRELIAILKYNRRMAVVTNQRQQAVLHPFEALSEENRQATDNKSLQIKASHKKGHWYSKGVEYSWKTGEVKNELTNKPVTIDFFPQGGATEGEILVYFGDLKNIIQVDGFTGRVSLKEIEDNDF